MTPDARGVDGVSDFDARHSRKPNDEVQFCAFDIMVEGDDDLRKLPLHLRKTSLERLLARRPEGLFLNPFEQGEIGPELSRGRLPDGLAPRSIPLRLPLRVSPWQRGRHKSR
jgi:hypothetical protein